MKVKVKKMFPPGHVRTPSYLRGKIGEVERDLGYFKNPEELAYGLNAHKQNYIVCVLKCVKFGAKPVRTQVIR